MKGKITNVSRVGLCGFVPDRLVVEDRPGLNFFPLNILFAGFKVENGKTIMGSALYEPDVSTFKVLDKIISMTYRNKYGGNNFVIISFREDNNTFLYEGEKFVNDKSVCLTTGEITSLKDSQGWSMFFTHLTMSGLSDGERCIFEEVL